MTTHEKILDPQAFPLFTTTNPSSHRIPKTVLDDFNNLMAFISYLIEENMELQAQIENLQKHSKSNAV